MNQKTDRLTSKDIASHIESMEEAAYHRGYQDAIKAITTSANQMQSSITSSNLDMLDTTTDLKAGSLIYKLYHYAKQHSGLTRIEVIRGLRASGEEFNDESAKTSLKRLVGRKLLQDQEGKLY